LVNDVAVSKAARGHVSGRLASTQKQVRIQVILQVLIACNTI
jgi:hypothetical protein